MEELVRRIRAARAYADMTQDDMAKRLDMSTVTYKRIERGDRQVSLTELDRIAEICGWPAEMFSAPELHGAGAERTELEALRSTISDLVERLADIEWRMRRNVGGGDADAGPT